MIAERIPIDRKGGAIMLFLCAILGLHQVAIKAAAPDIAPILQIALRSALSALLLSILMIWRKEDFSLRDGTLKAGIILGVAFSTEFLLVAEGLRFTTASHMAVFLYTAPLFTALILHRFLPAERLRRHQWIGISIAFGGTVVAFGGGMLQSTINTQVLWGDFLAILGGIAWASTTIIIRLTKLSDAPASKTLLYQLVAAFVLLLLYAIVSGQAARTVMTTMAWGSVLFQGVIITFAIYLAWFSLLRRYHASQLSVFLFLTPLFGVSFGILLLNEPLDLFFAVGALLVLAGLTLVSKS